MIMPRGQQLLLPANPAFIAVSIAVVFALSFLPLGGWVWVPDLLMLVLGFWALHQPQRVGLGIAFVLGLCIDVQQTSLLGQHALAYALLVFFAHRISRRLMWFSPPMQALQMLPLFLLAHVVQVLVRMAAGGMFPGFWMLLAPALECLLWPLAHVILQAPQRRPPDSDGNRPL